jgi:3-deoxy-D-manno-octulosonic-acid transferase
LGLHERNIPSILISAVFYPKHLIFNRLYGGIFRQILGYFRTIFVQNEDSKQAILKLPLANLPNVQVAPDTRIDRVVEIAQNAEKLPLLEAFLSIQITKNTSPSPVFVLGSTHIEDIRFWLAYLETFLGENWRIILVPHEVAPKYLNETLALLQKIPNMCPIRYSQLMQSAQSAANIPPANLLLVDTVGILNRIYQYADLVYVGGGFGGGVHNVLEAAVYGKPCIFAGRPRKISKFIELQDFIHENLAHWINPQDSPQLIRKNLDAFLASLSLDSAPTTQATRKTELAAQLNAYFERKKGGTAQILETIVEIMGVVRDWGLGVRG